MGYENSDDGKNASSIYPSSIEELGQRIEMVAEMAGGRKNASVIAGISHDMLTKYIQGKNFPKLDVIVRLCFHFDISLEWLAYGEGPMKRDNLLFDEDKAEEEGGTLAHAAMGVYVSLWDAQKLIEPEKFEELTFLMWEIEKAYGPETDMDPNDPLVKKMRRLISVSLKSE